MEKIGPYQITKELGRGGMGVVYKGVDPVIGRDVAIKTLRPEDMGEGGERATMGERLLREARSAGILSHPAIVTIYQAGQDGDTLYIAMEFVNGANLSDVLMQGRLTNEAILKILKQAAEGLDYAHSKGVVHRDIKPGNLMIEPSGKVKIADFGIAKLSQAGVTKTTSSVGSPAYMSPEHVRAQAIDGRADQYSLGVVAYEMLTSQRPHDSEELTSLVFKVVFEPPDLSLLQAMPNGAALEQVFAKVLSKSADDRYATCLDFYQALAAVLDPPAAGSGSNHTATVVMPGTPADLPVPPVTPPQPAPPSRKGVLYGGIGALALALAMGGYVMTRPDRSGGGDTKGGGEAKQERASPPVLIQQPECAHTPETQASGIHGDVGLMLDVTESGDVENIRVSKPLHPAIDARAVECVKKWRFQPSQKAGKAVRFPSAGVQIAF